MFHYLFIYLFIYLFFDRLYTCLFTYSLKIFSSLFKDVPSRWKKIMNWNVTMNIWISKEGKHNAKFQWLLAPKNKGWVIKAFGGTLNTVIYFVCLWVFGFMCARVFCKFCVCYIFCTFYFCDLFCILCISDIFFIAHTRN